MMMSKKLPADEVSLKKMRRHGNLIIIIIIITASRSVLDLETLYETLAGWRLVPSTGRHLVAAHVVDTQRLYPVMQPLHGRHHVTDELVRRLQARVHSVVREPLN